jgi:hypothetical protein
MAERIPDADGGVIAISKDGDIGFGWNSEQMAWAYSKGVDIHFGVNRGEDFVEPLDNSLTGMTSTSTVLPSSSERGRNDGSRSGPLNLILIFATVALITYFKLI